MPCPLCVIAAASGIVFTRSLGHSDGIAGIWIGAAIMITAEWIYGYLNKRNIKGYYTDLTTTFLILAPVIILLELSLTTSLPLYYGIFTGGVYSIGTIYLNRFAIEKYGKWHKYQTPVILAVMLSLLSLYIALAKPF